ncbi:hypothetical protein HNY73_016940 [Argiope bruennichi]|uniref:Uncharacterized protein n=1 Tax=Argiope bruennichi TaxID=94029 RepID=A0A8T0ENZ0_ARGBR|nr:hypothetical protein HNY73_016940 [Argiope bruennichi]
MSRLRSFAETLLLHLDVVGGGTEQRKGKGGQMGPGARGRSGCPPVSCSGREEEERPREEGSEERKRMGRRIEGGSKRKGQLSLNIVRGGQGNQRKSVIE